MGHFREYTPGLGMVLYLHVNAFFYPPIYCGTKSFFILLKHYFSLATSRTGCHFSPSGRKEATCDVIIQTVLWAHIQCGANTVNFLGSLTSW